MPRSNSPSATYEGISWGRRMRTSLTRGRRCRPCSRRSRTVSTARSAASKSSSVARSSEPLGSTSRSTVGQSTSGSVSGPWAIRPGSRRACGSTSSTASNCSTHPFGEPGVLRMTARPRMPAIPRDSRPSGLTRRMASASPGASRSMRGGCPRASGPGVKPVPPVDTTTPAKPSHISVRADATDSSPSATTRWSITS